MTGRDLIIYILENKLESERILNLMTIDEAAVKYNVGPATIRVWLDYDVISGIKLGDTIYILYNKGGIKNVE